MGVGIAAGSFADGFVRGMGIARQKKQDEQQQEERENKKKYGQAVAQSVDNANYDTAAYQGTEADALSDPEFGINAAYGKEGPRYSRGIQTITGERETPDMDRAYRGIVQAAGQYAPDELPGAVNALAGHQQTKQQNERLDKQLGFQEAQNTRAQEAHDEEQLNKALTRLYGMLPEDGKDPTPEQIAAIDAYVKQVGPRFSPMLGEGREFAGAQYGGKGRYAFNVKNAKTNSTGPETVNASADPNDPVNYWTRDTIGSMIGAGKKDNLIKVGINERLVDPRTNKVVLGADPRGEGGKLPADLHVAERLMQDNPGLSLEDALIAVKTSYADPVAATIKLLENNMEYVDEEDPGRKEKMFQDALKTVRKARKISPQKDKGDLKDAYKHASGKTVTRAQIEATAKARGMTPEEVIEKLQLQ